MSDPIAYTYEADTHCTGCAIARFGLTGRLVYGTDSEGNEAAAVYSWDEWHVHGESEPPYILACGTCRGVITTCEEDERVPGGFWIAAKA